jgi:hypothetical protein
MTSQGQENRLITPESLIAWLKAGSLSEHGKPVPILCYRQTEA